MSPSEFIWLLLGLCVGVNIGAWVIGLLNNRLIVAQRELIAEQSQVLGRLWERLGE